MKTKSSRPCLAFTLIELLVVIAILAILMALLLPTLKGARTSAYRSQCQNNQHQLAVGFSMYTEDQNGKLVPAWQYDIGTATDDGRIASNSGFQRLSFNINVTGSGPPYTPTSGFPAYGSHLAPFYYFPYINNEAVYNCPAHLRLNTPRAFYIRWPAPALIYSHYRGNPYFGYTGTGVGGVPGEFATIGSTTIATNSATYRIAARAVDINNPSSTILNYDADTYTRGSSAGGSAPFASSPHRFQCAYTSTPGGILAANAWQAYTNSDRTLAYNYLDASNHNNAPNIGFVHGGKDMNSYRGNFSFVDGHVESISAWMLADYSDKLWKLKH